MNGDQIALEGQTNTLSLRAAYAFGAAHGLEKEMTDIRDMVIEWDSSYTSTLRRGYVVELLENRGIIDQFKREHWLVGNTKAGMNKRDFYLRIKGKYEDFLAGRGPDAELSADNEDTLETEQTLEFALEAHLRGFLAKNLDHIERGLRMFSTPERTGVEFPVDGGRIDILALDRNDRFVVIELKLSQGRNRALGQLLYYMGWVDKNLGGGPCRGFIIANDISEELSIAVSRVAGVSLAKYRMNFAIELIGRD